MQISHRKFIEDYYKLNKNKFIKPETWGGYLPKSWFHDAFFNINVEIILKILKVWRKENLKKEILEDFKECLNYKTMRGNYFNRIINYRNQENREIIYHLIYFGLEVDENILETINDLDKKIDNLEEEKMFLEKLKAGHKIDNYIEEAMDDEFEIKPLRMRIDMRKIKDLYN